MLRGELLEPSARFVVAPWRPVAVVVTWLASMASHTAVADNVSFRRDVMAVLSKAGCNMGACHGNQNGKGGLRLSLRGQDPEFDHQWLTRESGGRRVDRLHPEASLALQKPLGELAHQGGVRFARGSREFTILRDWIAAGATGPRDSEPPLVRLHVTPRQQVIVNDEPQQVPLQVLAEFADGSRRDVAALATYEPADLLVRVSPAGVVERQSFGEATLVVRYLDQQVPVQLAFVPSRPDFNWSDPAEHNFVDSLVFGKLRSLRINPSELADDAVFVRRAYLDAIGILPTADEARAFLADARFDKRSRLIDELLFRPEFADLWAMKWSDVLRNEEKVLDTRGVDVFHRWLRDSMADGKPLDRFVRELVRGTGSTYDNPPANFYRANRDPATRAETTARLFLGVRLQCAKCHNHPFDRWTQDDYYSWSAIFTRIDYEIVKNDRRDKLDKNEFVGEQIVQVRGEGGMVNPRTGQQVEAKLLGDRPLFPGSYDDRLTPMAVWLTSPQNSAFARAQVNFIWYHLLGRGLIEPIDDVRTTNPASNEPLLAALADDFVAHGYDLRHLVRRIMNSRVYQLSAVPNESNRDDGTNFARAVIQRLPAEKLLDAQCQVLDAPAEFAGYPRGVRAGQLAGVRRARQRDRSTPGGDRFLKVFGKPERLLACECERSNETALSQAFNLIGGDDLQWRLSQAENRLQQLANSGLSDDQIVDDLYWSALSRPPTSEEIAAARQLLRHQGATGAVPLQYALVLFAPIELPPPTDRLLALQDVAWVLLNAKEFIFRH